VATVGFLADLDTLTRARYPYLWIGTHEEDRLLQMLRELVRTQEKALVTWTITQGIVKKDQINPDPRTRDRRPLVDISVDETADPIAALDYIAHQDGQLIAAVLDLHPFLTGDHASPTVIRRLRDLYPTLKRSNKSIVLVSPEIAVPNDLQKMVTVLDLPYPTKDELQAWIHSAIDAMSLRRDGSTASLIRDLLNSHDRATLEDQIASAGRGLTLDEFDNTIAKGFISRRLSIEQVLHEKSQIIKKSGTLEYFEPKERLDDIGGLENLKAWLQRANKRYSPEAKAFGLDDPKGLLLIGPPGTGKSLSAKVTATVLNLTMVRLSMGSIVSELYGKSTANMEKALKLAEAVAPCVLWIDEIEKGLSTGPTGEAHEETARLMSTFLTHFEECEAPILRVATTNDYKGLSGPLLQRFDKAFFVDLPNRVELTAIYGIHLRKRKQDPARFDLDTLGRESIGFVGREVRNMIREAMDIAFDQHRPLSMDDLLAEIHRNTPMSSQKKDEIKDMRDYGRKNCTPASVMLEEEAYTDEAKDRWNLV